MKRSIPLFHIWRTDYSKWLLSVCFMKFGCSIRKGHMRCVVTSRRMDYGGPVMALEKIFAPIQLGRQVSYFFMNRTNNAAPLKVPDECGNSRKAFSSSKALERIALCQMTLNLNNLFLRLS